MLINPSKTVGQIAVELPQSARVFERMKIDYCCGGERALSEACAAAGVETRRVITLLEESAALAAPPKIDLRESRLADLIVYILDTHHVFTREQMARLEQLAGKVIAAHGINHPELATVEALMRSLFAELEPHMRKEEQILFPFIVRLDQARRSHTSQPAAHFGTINNPIRMMMLEHDAAGEVLKQLRSATSDYQVPHDACASWRTFYRGLEEFEQDLHQHIHLENNILFPKAIALEANA